MDFGRIVSKPEVNPLPGRRCEVSLAMVDAISRSLCVRHLGLWSVYADLDGVDEAVANGRRERQAVFMADELRDLGVHGIEFSCVRGEVGAAAGRFRHLLQEFAGLFELLLCLARLCRRRFLFVAGLRVLQAASQRNSQQADVADFELLHRQQ